MQLVASGWRGPASRTRVRPTWLRYSDFTQEPSHIFELDAAELGDGDEAEGPVTPRE